MNYIEQVPDVIKRHMKRLHTEIVTDEILVKEALKRRGMEDCDSILVKKKTPNGKITRVIIYVGSPENVLHEIGHIVDIYDGSEQYWSGCDTFQTIYAEEKGLASDYEDYLTSNSKEYFAESFLDYVLDSNALRESRPQTHSWIMAVLSAISLYGDL